MVTGEKCGSINLYYIMKVKRRRTDVESREDFAMVALAKWWRTEGSGIRTTGGYICGYWREMWFNKFVLYYESEKA